MGLYSYDIAITKAENATVTASMCSAPTYTVSSVRLIASPVFRESATINGNPYLPGDPLLSASGGTVLSTSPFVTTGATVTARTATTITGTYSTATTAATFVVPFGVTFNAATAEHEVGATPRDYSYTASFISVSGGVTAVAETIIAGSIRVDVESVPRVPTVSSGYKACSVTQV